MKMKACEISSEDFRGWDAVTLSNDLIRLTAVPSIGGRLMGYDLGEYSFLYVNPELVGKMFTPEEHMGPDGSMVHWKNYGGDKTWPSPQGWSSKDEWPGPPDDILDSGVYTVTELSTADDGTAVIEMTSPPDVHRTGVQIVRRFQLFPGSSRLRQTLTFRNVSERPVCWSIWDVNQLRTERVRPDGGMEAETSCVVTCPVNPDSRFERGYNVMFADENNPQWSVDRDRGLFTANYLYEIGKVGIDSPGDWVAFANRAEGVALAELFTYFPGEEYPDSGVSVECWTVGRGEVAGLNYEGSGIYLLETEVLSPLYKLAPGESRSFEIEWGACRLNGMVVEAQPGGLTAEPLRVETEDGFARVTGAFGVFDAGRLALRLLDASGVMLAETDLGLVSPLAAVTIDHQFVLDLQVARVELVVTAQADGTTRRLASVQVGD
jgi:hypothetical protein